MAYPTRAELVAASSVTELTSKSTAQQDALRIVAIANVERHTGQVFEPSTDDLQIDGQGGEDIYLPKHAEEITGVTVRGTDYDITDVALSPDGDRLFFRPLSTSYAVEAMREKSFDSRTFRAGPGTVILEGTFGWTVTPDPVVQAIRIEMEEEARAGDHALAGTIATYRHLGMTDVAQGNLRFKIGDPALVSVEAARLLAPYVWTGPGGFVV